MGTSLSATSGILEQLAQALALLFACATLAALGCSGQSERLGPDDATGGASAGPGGDSAGADGTSGETSVTGETCDITRCDPVVSNRCLDDSCLCGDEPACSGKTPFCVVWHCVECTVDADCSGEEGPNTQCYQGACVECDPEDPAACSGTSLACSEQGECVPCGGPNRCPRPLFCDFESRFCKVCVEGIQCTDPLEPICVEYSQTLSECQPCASDEECAARDPERGQCVFDVLNFISGECLPCDPGDDGGCGADEECLLGSVDYECRGCVEDADCDDPRTPVCDFEAHTCVPCNDATIESPTIVATSRATGRASPPGSARVSAVTATRPATPAAPGWRLTATPTRTVESASIPVIAPKGSSVRRTTSASVASATPSAGTTRTARSASTWSAARFAAAAIRSTTPAANPDKSAGKGSIATTPE